jgi:c(7)-type cytochrome triheme protein
VFPQANLRFNHKVHVDLKIECERCHNSSFSADLPPEKRSMREDVKLATRFQLPKMQSCLECHDGSSAPSACDTCHLVDGTGRLQLTFPSGQLRPTQGDPIRLDHGPRDDYNH